MPITNLHGGPGDTGHGTRMGRKHEHGVVGRIVLLEMGGARVLQRIGDVVKRALPLLRILAANRHLLLKDLGEAIAGLAQAAGWGMRDPVGQQQVERVADLVFHAVQQIVQLLDVVVVEVLPHEGAHNHPMHILGGLLEDLDVRLLAPFQQCLVGFLAGEFGVSIQRHLAIDAAIQRAH